MEKQPLQFGIFTTHLVGIGSMGIKTKSVWEKIKPDFESGFNVEFDREIMISDRKRALFICGLSFLAVLWFNITGFFFSNQFPVIALNTFHNRNIYNWLTMAFVGLAGYELVYSLSLTFFLRRKRPFPFFPALEIRLSRSAFPRS